MKRRSFEPDDTTFKADAYKVRGWKGIAFYVLGWETIPDEDGEESRTGKVVVVMVGDDRHHIVEPDDIAAIGRNAYCGVCGQIGCAHDGLDRDNE